MNRSCRFEPEGGILSIYKILDEIRELAENNKEKGDIFEKLMLTFFKTEPTYSAQFKNVWLWQNWPGNRGLPDTGIDLVAENSDDSGFTAIQCKNYAPHVTLQKEDIDSFFTESGKSPFTDRIIVATTSRWSTHAENSLRGQDKPIRRIGIEALANSAIDWDSVSISNLGKFRLVAKKKRLQHQQEAIKAATDGLKTSDRGKLIMACGTGKTYTAQCIAEDVVGVGGSILVLVPSISLLSQTVKEWTTDSNIPINVYAVCSDSKAGKRREEEDISSFDLAIPATTNTDLLTSKVLQHKNSEAMTVIFSTYQSINIVADAQKKGIGEFDLIISDEAHRTTGVTLAGEEDSNFTRVHDQNFIKGKKRLYMTATPRMYGETAKAKAASADAILASMDDEDVYGQELYRLGFHEAVSRDLLTDYKVLVLTVNEEAIAEAFQKQLADSNHELKLDDATRIIGCLNAFAKHDPTNSFFPNDNSPMKRIVAFSNTINNSKKFKSLFSEVTDRFNAYSNRPLRMTVQVDHIDGSFNSLQREDLLGWLKKEPAETQCHVLSNARCLTEGVDVPALDGIVFLEPRNSMVDVVQAVGRVMRKSPNKKYGYVILPIGIPAGVTPEEALSDNKRYAAVWQVLNALRSHDERINAIINKLDLNNEPPEMIEIVPVGFSEETETAESSEPENLPKALQLEFPLDEIRQAIFARIVEKVGTRQYWENWAKDVAKIAERHIETINELLKKPNSSAAREFKKFLEGIQGNLNDSISRDDAIEMLAQHLITKPVFDAIFGNSKFTENNPVSIVMQKMINLLEEKIIDVDKKVLENFYSDVALRVEGIDNLQGKQKIITELYEKFFRIAFKRTAEKLGIVYTPIEIVDFIIESVEQILQSDFNSSLGKKDVHIIDPFAGTGTFIARLLQSELIAKKDLVYKYQNELHANELVLLAYYISAINIESVFHELTDSEYIPFDGMVLTDTFQMFEDDDKLDEVVFPQNNERVVRQKNAPIRVIIGNPPYSVGQEFANDNNSNMKYPTLDKRISNSYAANSTTILLRSLYDSYIRAIRWASDRIGDNGVIGFVTNGSFIDNKAMDGFRKCLVEEFSDIYVFNLRGNARTSGELRRKEKGNVFGEGTRTPVAITLFVKRKDKDQKAEVHYFDIGDYLTKEEKLNKISQFKSIESINWDKVSIDSYGDWINQRDESFMTFDPMGDKSGKGSNGLFELYSPGVKTNRDIWAYNFSSTELEKNIKFTLKNYDEICLQVDSDNLKPTDSRIQSIIEKNSDPSRISWDRSLIKSLSKREKIDYDPKNIRETLYRPYCKKFLYFGKQLNNDQGQIPKMFPDAETKNLAIALNYNPLKPFGVIMTNIIPDVQLMGNGQCFPLFVFKRESDVETLFDVDSSSPNYSIKNEVLEKYRKKFGAEVSQEDIFYYVYGLLHQKKYRKKFAVELGKSLPRIPIAEAFWEFSKSGKLLSDLHVNYENSEVATLNGLQEILKSNLDVRRLRYDKSTGDLNKSRIIVNDSHLISDIPEEIQAYDLNGRSALDWVIDRYEIKTDENSKIVQNPNLWKSENYVLNLVGRVVSVSQKTIEIVDSLPSFE
jgi:predicted helicase